ncbi:MAG: dethiobiotin synthase [Gemmatimonadaceae bacterium]|nr:dethiobiotin synthase [Gemmatimonadaceae bacterium]
MIRLGITGTDTGVGKTVVTCTIAAGLTARGLRVAAMKPVETGVAPDDVERDGARLARAAGGRIALATLAPITFPEPLAPLVASRQAGRPIDPGLLDRAVDAAAAGADALLVEGAGGLLVPVTESDSFAELFRRWRLDTLIVAANRLGVINHVRLTTQTARRAGLHVCAIALNHVNAASDASMASNAALLHELEHVPVIEFPWQATARHLDGAVERLLHLLPSHA